MLREIGDSLLNEDSSILYKPALIDLSTGKARYYTYYNIDDMVSYVANGFVKMGLAVGSKIAILGVNSFEFLVSYVGARRAGLTPVLINYKLSNAQINEILIHSESRVVLYDAEFKNKIPAGFKKCCINNYEFEQFIIRKPFEGSLSSDDIPAVILYTSGSTGTPKGVSISNKSRRWNIDALMNMGNRPIKCLSATPLYHNNGLSNIERSLMEGSTLLLLPKFDVELFSKVLNAHRVRFISGFPSMFAMLFDHPNLIPPKGFSNVTKITLATAPTSPALYRKITEVFKNASKITIKYGSTEAGAGVFGDHETLPTPPMSVGYPKPNYDYKLVNDVLHIRSPGTLSGYYKNSEATSGSLDEEGYYITKDKFTVDENGFYFFMGRADDMFVCGGENIYPSEVEEILEEHPAIVQAVVLGIDDTIKGMKPYAFVKTTNKYRDEAEIQKYFLDNAPAYMHPRKIWFVDDFPLTAVNKIDKNELITRAKTFIEQLEQQEG